MWPFTLSGRLPVFALVGHYPTNQLIGRRLIFQHEVTPTFGRIPPGTWSHRVLAQVSLGCPRLKGRLSTCYSPVRHLPFNGIATVKQLVRLACVRHAASVSPEPGSNSPQKILTTELQPSPPPVNGLSDRKTSAIYFYEVELIFFKISTLLYNSTCYSAILKESCD